MNAGRADGEIGSVEWFEDTFNSAKEWNVEYVHFRGIVRGVAEGTEDGHNRVCPTSKPCKGWS